MEEELVDEEARLGVAEEVEASDDRRERVTASMFGRFEKKLGGCSCAEWQLKEEGEQEQRTSSFF